MQPSLPISDLPVSKALSKAIGTFGGDWQHAAEWMRAPRHALDDRTPFDVARDADGYKPVVAVPVRTDHGVHS